MALSCIEFIIVFSIASYQIFFFSTEEIPPKSNRYYVIMNYLSITKVSKLSLHIELLWIEWYMLNKKQSNNL